MKMLDQMPQAMGAAVHPQLAKALVMVRPVDFGFNEETAKDNEFQTKLDDGQAVRQKALAEFEQMVSNLRQAGIQVLVLEQAEHKTNTPDAVFPNNWFSTNANGVLTVYPMYAENRRQERRVEDLCDLFASQGYEVGQVDHIAPLDEQVEVLEGTGVLVIDHINGVLYASESERCHQAAFHRFAKRKGFKETHLFQTASDNGKPIYHTNVMMSVGQGFAVICADCFVDTNEYQRVKHALAQDHEVIEITKQQMEQHFCGNILHVQNAQGEAFIVMSQSAFDGFTQVQKQQLAQYGKPLVNDISTIETVGGGSARCMIAEVFLNQPH